MRRTTAPPRRGGQGTFDKIVQNIRLVAHKTRIAIGGNFEMDTAESYPALLDFLKEQDFAGQLSKVAFKPVIRERKTAPAQAIAPAAKGAKFIALTAVGDKPLNGACMTGAGAAVSSGCDSCHQLDDQMAFLREETKKRGFPTVDGVHLGPCEIHRSNAHPSVPTAALRLPRLRRRHHAVGRPHRRPRESARAQAAVAVRGVVGVEGMPRLRIHSGVCRRLHRGRLHRARQRDRPNRHKPQSSGRHLDGRQPRLTRRLDQLALTHIPKEGPMKNGKKQRKTGTLRPWLVDVVVDNLR